MASRQLNWFQEGVPRVSVWEADSDTGGTDGEVSASGSDVVGGLEGNEWMGHDGCLGEDQFLPRGL